MRPSPPQQPVSQPSPHSQPPPPHGQMMQNQVRQGCQHRLATDCLHSSIFLYPIQHSLVLYFCTLVLYCLIFYLFVHLLYFVELINHLIVPLSLFLPLHLT